MAVVQVQAEWSRFELVREVLADRDQSAADLLAYAWRTVHDGGVDAVEVNCVRMRPRIDEVDPQQVAFTRAQRRAGNTAVVCPRGVLDARDDLDLLVVGDELPLTHR